MMGMKTYRVCIVGATGIVGRAIVSCLEKRKFPISELTLFASPNSCNKELKFRGKIIKVKAFSEEVVRDRFDFAFLSTDETISKKIAPVLVKMGTIVVDNSSAFRMEKDVPLVVPEVNADDIKKNKGILSNPNCATIQLVMVIKPFHDYARVKRIVVSTYQAISGAGENAMAEFRDETYLLTRGDKFIPIIRTEEFYKQLMFPRQIAFNVIPQIPQKNAFVQNGYTIEEMKIINETRKILGDEKIGITATCVRVPVFNGHSESVNIETEKKLTSSDAIKILSQKENIKVCSERDKYPTPAEVSGLDFVFVGRIREDPTIKNGINLWIVGDNILKGAALNAVQIAEYIINEKS